MLHYLHRTIMNPSEGGNTATTFTTAATVLITFSPSRPVRIVRYGVVITTAVTGVNPFQLVGSVFANVLGTGTKTTGSTTTVQSATGYNSSNTPVFYVDTAGGTCTVPTASFSSLSIGAVVWHNVNPQAAQTGGYYPAPDAAFIPPGGVSTQLVIYPGQSFQVAQANTLTAGAGVAFLEVEEQAFQADFNNNQLVASGMGLITPSILPTPSDPFANGAVNAQT